MVKKLHQLDWTSVLSTYITLVY